MHDPLAEAAQRSPEATALYLPVFSHLGDQYAVYSYARLNTIVANQAMRLSMAGLRPGDRVALLIDNPQRAIETIHALIRSRAVFVPLNTRLTPAELRYQIEMVEAKLVLCDLPNEEKAVEAAGSARVYTISPTVQSVVAELPNGDYFGGGFSDYLTAEVDPNAVQAIVFTSGTTGKPKGAQITLGNLIASARASAQRIGARPDDRWLLSLPLYHVGGLSVVIRSTLYGTTVVLPGPSREPEDLIAFIESREVTLISLVPTQLHRMLKIDFNLPPTLRLILLGGAAASPELLAQCCEYGFPVATTYGLTEAASQVATMLPEDVCRKTGSVGKPLKGTTIRIVDEAGNTLSAGEIGEIVVSGATVMKGYLGHDSIDPAEGFHTGDLGYLDADGDLWLVQRRSDLIVSGGENIYPSEVETVLKTHPDVIDACVVGLPDAEWGERVAAMVILRDGNALTEAELIAFSRERLAGYKQPRKIVFADELPQTASGKVKRPDVIEALLKA